MDYRDEYARCMKEDCARKENCLRHLLKQNGQPGVFAFVPFECSDENNWDNQIVVEDVSFVDI